MKIKLHEIAVKDVVANYIYTVEDGVKGYGGKLDIRPKYQREFIYKDKQRDLVMDTVRKDFPLNVMYWVKNGEDSYEVLDGQQRTISICEYVHNKYSIDYEYFHTLPKDKQDQILNYKLMIYICEGTDSEKLDWFRTINIAGEKLTNQELRNAVYTSEWLTDAKRYFSKSSCPAYQIAEKYMNGSPIRQDYLETALKWISDDNIEQYMADHQTHPNANELWLYFQAVITWVQMLFPKYRKEMKGIDWGFLYNKHKGIIFDANKAEEKIAELMADEDVTNKKGIYIYLLEGNEKYLNIRAFSDKQKREAYERQKGICPMCKEHFELVEMHADHYTPWSKGGQTTAENCQMLCRDCNLKKSDK